MTPAERDEVRVIAEAVERGCFGFDDAETLRWMRLLARAVTEQTTRLAEAKQLGLEAVRLAESADLDAMALPRGAGGCGAATKYTNDIAAARAALEAL